MIWKMHKLSQCLSHRKKYVRSQMKDMFSHRPMDSIKKFVNLVKKKRRRVFIPIEPNQLSQQERKQRKKQWNA